MSGAGRFAPVSEEEIFLIGVGMNERVKEAFKEYNEYVRRNGTPAADATSADLKSHYEGLLHRQRHLMQVLFKQGVLTEAKMKGDMPAGGAGAAGEAPQVDRVEVRVAPGLVSALQEAGREIEALAPVNVGVKQEEPAAPSVVKHRRRRVRATKSSSDDEEVAGSKKGVSSGRALRSSKKRAGMGDDEIASYNFRPRSTEAGKYTEEYSSSNEDGGEAPRAIPLSQDRRAQLRARKVKAEQADKEEVINIDD